jgi:hypothetical protein
MESPLPGAYLGREVVSSDLMTHKNAEQLSTFPVSGELVAAYRGSTV